MTHNRKTLNTGFNTYAVEEGRSILINRMREMFLLKGFAVSETELGGYPSFDLIARKEERRFIVKILQNIDTFRESSAVELIRLANLVTASPFVVGDRASSGKLEPGVVYYRHSVPILSSETLSQYLDGDGLFISSGPGGYYVSIDGHKLRSARERLGYSIGYLSNRVGVSRRSISLYESGSAVSVDIFLKLEEMLDCDLRKFLNLTEVCNNLQARGVEESMDDFFREVFEIMSGRGFEMQGVKRTPFDAVAKERIEDVFLVGLLEDIAVKNERVRAIRHLADIFGNQSFVISKNSTTKENYGGCPVLNMSEIKEAADGSDINRLIEKRKSVA